MPLLQIVSPHLEPEIKIRLAQCLTDEFARITKFDREIFEIYFDEHRIGDIAIGGQMWTGLGKPMLHFLLLSPKLKKSVKIELVSSFTRIFVEATGHHDWLPVIHLSEHSYDNIGVDGELLSIRFPELSKRTFYYPLPDDE